MTLHEWKTSRPEIYAIACSDPVVIRHSVRVERLEAGLTASNEVTRRAAAHLQIAKVELEVITRTINSLEREYKYRIDKLKRRLQAQQDIVSRNLRVRDMPAEDRAAEKMTAIDEAKAIRDAVLLATCKQLAAKPGLVKMNTELIFTGEQQ